MSDKVEVGQQGGVEGYRVTFNKPSTEGQRSTFLSNANYAKLVAMKLNPSFGWGTTAGFEQGRTAVKATNAVYQFLQANDDDDDGGGAGFTKTTAIAQGGGFNPATPSRTPPASGPVRYIHHFDIETAGAGEASVDFSLPYEVSILNVEMYISAGTGTLTKVEQAQVAIVGGTGSGIPVTAITASSIVQGRLSGRRVSKTNPMTFTTKHSAAAKTTVVLHLDQGPGTCPQ